MAATRRTALWGLAALTLCQLAAAEEEKPAEAKAEPPHELPAVASVMFLGIFLAIGVYAMTQTSRPNVGNNMVLVLDNVIAIFLAVLWFQGFDDLTELLPTAHHKFLASTIHASALLLAVCVASHLVRNKAVSIAIFCGAGAHYCAFASGHTSLAVQDAFFQDHPGICFLGTIIIFIALVAGGVVIYLIKKSMGYKPGEESEEEGRNVFIDRFDDVETDFAGMALAMYWAVFVQFAIVGEFPEDGGDIDPGAKPTHTDTDRFIFLAYTVVLFVLGPLVIHKVSHLAGRTYLQSRLTGLFGSFVAMSIAFSFMNWGKMQLYEHEAVSVTPMMARVYFAAICSFVAMSGIFLISFLRCAWHKAAASALTALGLIAGYAWEETFDQAIDNMVDGTDHESSGKICIALVSALIILPVYASFIKPKTMKAAEALEKAAEAAMEATEEKAAAEEGGGPVPLEREVEGGGGPGGGDGEAGRV